MNYTLEEHANDVVYHIQTVCDEAGVPHPTIVSESGRAVVAYHSVLVFNVLGVSGFGDEGRSRRTPNGSSRSSTWSRPTTTSPPAMRSRRFTMRSALDMAISLFNGGYLPLDQRSTAENLFWAICTRLQKIVQTMGEVPRICRTGRAALRYILCNFSLFQSIPDAWAIKQLFQSCRFTG